MLMIVMSRSLVNTLRSGVRMLHPILVLIREALELSNPRLDSGSMLIIPDRPRIGSESRES
jgi:hypothetical protein